MENAVVELRAVAFKEGDSWVAQCLDYDICAQASDLNELKDRFEAVVLAEAQESLSRTGVLFGGIPAASKEFEAKWNEDGFKSKGLAKQQQPSTGVAYELALCA